MKKILITGASGFVGSLTEKALQDEYELITPSHSQLDITSEEDLENVICRTTGVSSAGSREPHLQNHESLICRASRTSSAENSQMPSCIWQPYPTQDTAKSIRKKAI